MHSPDPQYNDTVVVVLVVDDVLWLLVLVRLFNRLPFLLSLKVMRVDVLNAKLVRLTITRQHRLVSAATVLFLYHLLFLYPTVIRFPPLQQYSQK